MSSALSTAKSLAKYNNDLERSNVALQYQYNRSLAQEDRSWQERMSNSAHQREIADLKKAGLNPVLSITGGNGASTPSGSSASVSKADVDMSLPRAVMDMAMAQLNSATQLQTTAMQTSNALTIAREQMASDWKQHITPSGSSIGGQLSSFPYFVQNAMSGLLTFDKYLDSLGLTGALKRVFKSHGSGVAEGGTYKNIDDLIAHMEVPADQKKYINTTRKYSARGARSVRLHRRYKRYK